MKIGVITMMQRRDFPHAAASIASLEGQLSGDVRHFLLLNDERDEEIESRYRDRDHYDLILAGENLGVAGGRNALIERAMDWGADLLVAFDDDLVAPTDYLQRLADAHAWLDKHTGPVGVIAPTIIDFHAVRTVLFREEEIEALESGECTVFRSNEEMRATLRRRAPEMPEQMVFHMGIRDWRTHYLRGNSREFANLHERIAPLFGKSGRINWGRTIEKSSARARRYVLASERKALPVDTLPGGVSVYSRELIEKIGPTDSAFGPFGFEDSEFCVRALRHGYKNFCVPNEIIIHDFQSRLRTRNRRVAIATRGKMRALFLRKHVHPSDMPSVAADMLAWTLIDVVQAYRLVRQIESISPGQFAQWLVSYFASVVSGLYRSAHAGDETGDLRTWLADAGASCDPPVTFTGDLAERSDDRLVVEHGTIGGNGAVTSFERIEIESLDTEGMERGTAPRWCDISASGLTFGDADGVLDGTPIDLRLRFRYDERAGVFDLEELTVGVRSLGTFTCALELEGVGPDARPEADDSGISIARGRAVYEDTGLMRAIGASLAEEQDIDPLNALAWLAPLAAKAGGEGVVGRFRSVLARFVSVVGEAGGRIECEVRPSEPVAISELESCSTGEAVLALLGVELRSSETASVAVVG